MLYNFKKILGIFPKKYRDNLEFYSNNLKLIVISPTGKSAICERIVEAFDIQRKVESKNCVTVIPMESFYKPTTNEQRQMASYGHFNLDHPSAFDETLLFKTLTDLLNGRTVKVNIKYKTINKIWNSTRYYSRLVLWINLDCSL